VHTNSRLGAMKSYGPPEQLLCHKELACKPS
jgi:hypothetical protein